MLFANTKTLMSILLAISAIPTGLCAPTSNSVDAIAVREISSTAPLDMGVDLSDEAGVSRAITERDAANDVHLAKRYLIGSPYQKRTIQVGLKKAVHGLAAGTTWLWEISYGYTTTNGGKEGRLNGNLVKGDGSFAWGPFKIDQSFVSSVDGIVTATFNAVVARTNEKIQLTLTWAEEFTSKGATLEDHGRSSFFTYFSANGRQERLGQDFFQYGLIES
jgi:hypothetical protein